MSKQNKLEKLVRARKERFKHYKCLGDYQDGRFECVYVSPYSKGAHNLEPDVMILLQDWSSDEALARSSGPSELGRDPQLPTNRNLASLLEKSLGLKLHDTYATNLFPYIKAGGLSSRIPFGDLVFAAENFGIPQIRIVAPKLVVCLGKNTFNALRIAAVKMGLASDLARCRDTASAIGSPFEIEVEGGGRAAIWAQAHPGAWGQRNRNREQPGRTSEDWKQMSQAVGLGLRE